LKKRKKKENGHNKGREEGAIEREPSNVVVRHVCPEVVFPKKIICLLHNKTTTQQHG